MPVRGQHLSAWSALAEDPTQDHPVGGGFELGIAPELQAACVATPTDPLMLIKQRRQRWYTDAAFRAKGQHLTDWPDLDADSQRAILSRHGVSDRSRHPAPLP